MKFGAHISISGGIEKAPSRAAEIGCDCFQLFVGNPRGWNCKPFTEKEGKAFQSECKRLKLGPVIAHDHIGKGYIGKTGFKTILSSQRLRRIPFILETPGEDGMDKKNLALIRKLAKR